MLNEILTLDVYRFFLIFTRIGAALMILPGFGGHLVSTRIRLLFALALSLILLPVVGRSLPPLSRHVADMVLLVGSEALVGVYMGMLGQALMAALHVAGTVIGFQVGLTNAFSFDAVAEQQSTLLTSFFTNLGLVIIFATDLHHLMLRALADSYATFQPGQLLPLGDFTESFAKLLTDSFAFGVKLSAPLLAFGLIFYGALGLVSRLTPQVQVFFIAMPLQLIGGLWMMMVSLPLVILLFLRFFEDGLVPFVR